MATCGSTRGEAQLTELGHAEPRTLCAWTTWAQCPAGLLGRCDALLAIYQPPLGLITVQTDWPKDCFEQPETINLKYMRKKTSLKQIYLSIVIQKTKKTVHVFAVSQFKVKEIGNCAALRTRSVTSGKLTVLILLRGQRISHIATNLKWERWYSTPKIVSNYVPGYRIAISITLGVNIRFLPLHLPHHPLFIL